MGTNQVLIPMSIKALIVGGQQGSFAVMEYNYSSLDSSPLGDEVEPSPNGSHPGIEPGIHLHWILPKIMRQGVQQEGSDEVSYPAVPDRWLVTRIWTPIVAAGAAPNPSVRSMSWIVESDALQKKTGKNTDNSKSPQFPALDDRQQQYRFLGRSYPATQTRQPCDRRLEAVLATASGLPAFSMYYPGCRNVFGFYDAMQDENGKKLQNITVSYVVCGYYSVASNDILSGMPNADSCKKKLGWDIPADTDFPAASLCHGILSGISWVTAATQYASNVPVADPDLAVGNTTAEALAALAEHKAASGFATERMLNLFYAGGDSVLRFANGLIKGENLIHERRFGEETPITQVAFKVCGDAKKAATETLPVDEIYDINLRFVELFKMRSAFRDLQEQVFDCWYKYMSIGEADYSIDIGAKKKAVQCQEKYLAQLANFEQDIAAQQANIRDFERLLQEDVNRISDSLEYHSVVYQNGQSFFSPNNPVLLLSGIRRDPDDADDPADTVDSADVDEDSAKLLYCRNASQVISSLTIDALDGVFSDPVTVTPDDVDCFGIIANAGQSLVREALLLSPDFSGNLAWISLGKKGKQTAENLATLAPVIQKLQLANTVKSIVSSVGRERLALLSGFNGAYPDKTACSEWKTPWSPLFLNWSVNVYPDPLIIADVPTLQNWKLDNDATDFQFTGKITTETSVVIQGQSILALNGPTVTAGCVARHLGDDLLVADSLGLDVLSQSLAVNDAFIMEKTDLILPIDTAITKSIDLGEGKISPAKVAAMIASCESEVPIFDEFFSPIRACFMKLDFLTIVDSFGQCKKIGNLNVAVGEDLGGGAGLDKAMIMLAPRLVQPSRLNFRWLNPADDTPRCENDAVSPICGWLLPNHTDRSVMVYSRDGDLLGSLQWVSLNVPVVWKNPPERGGGTGSIPDGMDRTMKAVVSAILGFSESPTHDDLLTPLLNVIDSALWSINPSASQQYNSLGQYVGRPLILVNACVSLEQKNIQKKFKHLETRAGTGAFNANVDVSKAKFPVYVGRAENHGDGVIGFFLNDDYSTLRIAASSAPSTHRYFDADNTLSLSTGDERPSKLTLLMDFAASVDLISGILPTKTIKPNDDAIGIALGKLFLTVFCAPVLGDSREFAVPCPKLDGKDWQWLHRAHGPLMEDAVAVAGEQAYFPDVPVCAQEGWLKLKLNGNPAEMAQKTGTSPSINGGSSPQS